MNEEIYITESIKQTQDIARQLASKLCLGDCLAFYGNLGSGKTTFIQALAKYLGIKRRIISPTFIIVRTYELRFNAKDLTPNTFYHIDRYRTQTHNDLLSVGINDILEDKKAITAFEWADKLGSLLPQKRYDLIFDNLGENKRKIVIKKNE